jgi:hypothetical protein
MVNRFFRTIAGAAKACGAKPANALRLTAFTPKAIAVRRFIAYIARNPHLP